MEQVRKYVLLLVLLSMGVSVLAQTKPKSKQQEAPPTQQEMAEMMKEMEAAMDDISPEDKKAMDSMGFKMPDMNAIKKTISGVSDAQLKEAYDNENRIVPLRDVSRIGSIPKLPLTDATLSTFVSAAHGKVVLQLKPAS